jgi:photosynthetic reaction center cytochrome c subunit
MRSLNLRVWLGVVAAGVMLTACERPPVDSVQRGYRGTAMVEVYNPRTVAAQVPGNQLPEAIPAVPQDGPAASTVYKNVQVLGNVSIAEFTRTMVAMTAWVSPKEGCTYCHAAGEDFAADKLYTKVVARRMLQMTQHINADWKNHVAGTGVTCYTCHRGNPVPKEVWYTNPGPTTAKGMAGNRAGQNSPAPQVGMTSLPYDPFTPFFSQAADIRVVGTVPLPAGNRHSIKQTEWTYGLMVHMSQSLGVNCTYCHNSRSFAAWDGSTPQRGTAYYGIRMVRDLNNAYLDPLKPTFPANRLGPTGDAPKLNCATCHQGAYKPMYGASQLNDHPVLSTVTNTPVAAATPAPVAMADDSKAKSEAAPKQ